MFTPKKSTQPDPLQQAIDGVLSEMTELSSETEEYSAMVDQLAKLYKIQNDNRSRNRVSPDALVGLGGNLLGILLILNYERANIVTSKAISFVPKLR